MKINRKELLRILSISSVGITKREILEQSNSIIFDSDSIVSFNDSIFTKAANPLPELEGAVPADDLLALLAKFPDDEVDISTTESELRVKGKNRTAGITMSAEVHLPYSDVPGPDKWKDLPPELLGTMRQAALVCGKDEALITTTVVHLTPKWVEACDNFRLFRSEMEVDIKSSLLIPAASLLAIGDLTFHRFSINGGWMHFETKDNHQVSIRCSKGKFPDLGPLLKLEDPKKIVLPSSLPDILERAEIMQDFNAMVHITIAEGKLSLLARKDAGWLKESKKIEYSGEPLKFEINNRFFQEILSKTRKVSIAKKRMRIKSGGTVCILGLEIAKETE